MEEEYADIYYVDTRNAVRDNRPGSRPAWTSAPRRPVVVPPPVRHPVPYTQPYAQPFPQQQPVIYTQPPMMNSTAAALFGRLSAGQLVEEAVKIIAALQSLPTAPAPTKDSSTDMANMVTYQSALADHAKKDERLRTLGSLVARLVG